MALKEWGRAGGAQEEHSGHHTFLWLHAVSRTPLTALAWFTPFLWFSILPPAPTTKQRFTAGHEYGRPSRAGRLRTWVHMKSLRSVLSDPMDYSPPGSSAHGILQARILEWVVMPSSRGSSWPIHLLWLLHCRRTLYPRSPLAKDIPGLMTLLQMWALQAWEHACLCGPASAEFECFISLSYLHVSKASSSLISPNQCPSQTLFRNHKGRKANHGASLKRLLWKIHPLKMQKGLIIN